MHCVKSISFIVLINRATSLFFKTSRGIHQGCTLAPYHFILVEKGLIRSIIVAKREGNIAGNQARGLEFVSQLLFVDDFFNIFTWFQARRKGL